MIYESYFLKSGKRFVNGSGALVRWQKSRQSGIVVALAEKSIRETTVLVAGSRPG